MVAAIYNYRRRGDARLVLARTIYGEARGEGLAGMEAVASVVMNRTVTGGWWGDDVISVCLKPWQFSVWNAGDPNRALILSKEPGSGDPNFDMAYSVAGRAMAGELVDRTNGATHYHTRSVAPGWAANEIPVAEIGGHVFYKGIA